jgi:CRISPR-associated protein Cpf1
MIWYSLLIYLVHSYIIVFFDFYKDLDIAMYHRSFECISDECIEKLQNENKLWLFQIYCQDFSEHKKVDSNKNIHTLIFESFFSEENKVNNFPIRLNAGFEIRYRDAGLTDGFVHKIALFRPLLWGIIRP